MKSFIKINGYELMDTCTSDIETNLDHLRYLGKVVVNINKVDGFRRVNGNCILFILSSNQNVYVNEDCTNLYEYYPLQQDADNRYNELINRLCEV